MDQRSEMTWAPDLFRYHHPLGLADGHLDTDALL